MPLELWRESKREREREREIHAISFSPYKPDPSARRNEQVNELLLPVRALAQGCENISSFFYFSPPSLHLFSSSSGSMTARMRNPVSIFNPLREREIREFNCV